MKPNSKQYPSERLNLSREKTNLKRASWQIFHNIPYMRAHAQRERERERVVGTEASDRWVGWRSEVGGQAGGRAGTGAEVSVVNEPRVRRAGYSINNGGRWDLQREWIVWRERKEERRTLNKFYWSKKIIITIIKFYYKLTCSRCSSVKLNCKGLRKAWVHPELQYIAILTTCIRYSNLSFICTCWFKWQKHSLQQVRMQIRILRYIENNLMCIPFIFNINFYIYFTYEKCNI